MTATTADEHDWFARIRTPIAGIGCCGTTGRLRAGTQRRSPEGSALSAISPTVSGPSSKATLCHFERCCATSLGVRPGLVIELRTAENVNDRLPGPASELLALPVDVLVTQSSPSAVVAKKATNTVPIVFHRVTDPVAQGLVASVARPGGNVTGVALLPVVGAKQLELMQATIPGLRRIATIITRWLRGGAPGAEFERAARTLGLELHCSPSVTPRSSMLRWSP